MFGFKDKTTAQSYALGSITNIDINKVDHADDHMSPLRCSSVVEIFRSPLRVV
ncbi:MAG: hypothetical protein IJE92_05425 [Clostridia bacterium]|nr:hypothetical protein [Clostridia bacterium]